MSKPLFFFPDSGRTQVWRCGGGTQSTAIAVLIAQGRLPKPEIACMVDTIRENSSTWAYLEQYTNPLLKKAGVDLQIIDKTKYATVDLYSTKETLVLLPGYTTQSGSVGKLTNYCSGEWKIQVINRWLREQNVEQCDNWIGFSLDEMRRVKNDRRLWARSVYPLLELRMRRSDCVKAVTEIGWPEPPRSSCWMCPNKLNDEWREMRENNQEDFAKAVALERMIRCDDPHFWLHKQCKPLDECDFSEPEGLFVLGCDSGMCFV